MISKNKLTSNKQDYTMNEVKHHFRMFLFRELLLVRPQKTVSHDMSYLNLTDRNGPLKALQFCKLFSLFKNVFFMEFSK